MIPAETPLSPLGQQAMIGRGKNSENLASDLKRLPDVHGPFLVFSFHVTPDFKRMRVKSFNMLTH